MLGASVEGIVEGPVFRSINKGGRISLTRLNDRSVANIVKAIILTALEFDPRVFFSTFAEVRIS